MAELTQAKRRDVDQIHEFERELRALAVTLCDDLGFQLITALYESAEVREHCIAWLRDVLAQSGCAVRTLDVRQGSARVPLSVRLAQCMGDVAVEDRTVIMVVGLDALFRCSTSRVGRELIAQANRERGLLPDSCPTPVVFWLTTDATQEFARLARDLWQWRSGTFDFVVDTRGAVGDLIERQAFQRQRFSAPVSNVISELEEQIARLEPQAGDPAAVPPAYRARLLIHLADAYRGAGELERARNLYGTAANLARAAHDERLDAAVTGRLADLLEISGELTLALAMRRNDQLPVFERLGDIRGRTVTLGRIADTLEALGELEEALRIRQHDQLPVYERIGDVRARAITLGKIADILSLRGDHDEALRIRETEQLPVFERLGDMRERAATMGKIADILECRGKLDEALNIRAMEQLPVYAELGDVLEEAITTGQIAQLLAAKGETEEARRLQCQALDTHRQLQNKDGIAASLWGLARLDMADFDWDGAVPRLAEAWQLFTEIGRAEGVAIVGSVFGQLLAATDMPEEARHVLRSAEEAFRRQGRSGEAEEVAELLAAIDRRHVEGGGDDRNDGERG